jgi:hypothetical protein
MVQSAEAKAVASVCGRHSMDLGILRVMSVMQRCKAQVSAAVATDGMNPGSSDNIPADRGGLPGPL